MDDLDVFAAHPGIRGCSREVHVARCCALTLNAALLCSKAMERPVQVCATSFEDSIYGEVYGRYFDNLWCLSSEIGNSDTEEGRRVWMKRANGSQILEFLRLNDAVLALRRILIADVKSAS
jgi:hypothetical protein